MSRRKGRSTPSSVGSNRSAPLVAPDTVAFLRRSLQRNDVELAAVEKLNQQLHTLRNDTIGDETIVLALGAGKIRLAEPQVTMVKDEKLADPSPDEKDIQAAVSPQLADTPEAAALTLALKEACVDFLQRYLLRRKLLNRLFRRLLRVSATMDTTDAGRPMSVDDPSKPPPLPRYGEDKLVVDPRAVQVVHEKVQRQCQAWERKLQRQEQQVAGDDDENAVATDNAAFLEFKDLYTRVRDQAEVYYVADTGMGNGKNNKSNQPAPWNGVKIAVAQRNLSAKEKEAEYQRWKVAIWGRIPLQPTFEEIQPRVFSYDERLAAAKEAAERKAMETAVKTEDDKGETQAESKAVETQVKTAEGETSPEAVKVHDEQEKPKDAPEQDKVDAKADDKMEVELESNAEAKNEQIKNEKVSDPSVDTEEKNYTQTETKKASKDSKEETVTTDARADPKPSIKSKESPLATKNEDSGKDAVSSEKADEVNDEEMQDMDTMEVENLVEKPAANKEDEEMKDVGPDKKEVTGSNSSGEEGKDDEEAASEDGGSADEKAASRVDADNEKTSDDKKSDQEKHKEKAKIVRPISLVPVPSFYEQDLKRLKVIHADIMSVSMQDFARRRTQEVVNDYNKALRKSNELNERRSRIHSQLSALMQDNRSFVAQVTKNYKTEWEATYKLWNSRRQEFENARLNSYMPHRNNPHHRPNGTALTKVYAGQPDPARRAVAHCLGDILDTAIGAYERKFPLERFTEEFRPPQRPDIQSNTNYSQNQITEERLKQEYSAITAELRISEDERQKAWKRMMKTKAEFDVPHGRTPIDVHNYSLMPLPSLRHSGGDSASRNAVPSVSLPMDASAVSRLPQSTAPMPSRPPMPGASGNSGTISDSKYSAARVRERISSDGTVAPVTAPKRTKEGLFVRPAGRTRKGMEWDAVRGIWVPAADTSSNPSQTPPPGPSW